jgi:hypothetical protein
MTFGGCLSISSLGKGHLSKQIPFLHVMVRRHHHAGTDVDEPPNVLWAKRLILSPSPKALQGLTFHQNLALWWWSWSWKKKKDWSIARRQKC